MTLSLILKKYRWALLLLFIYIVWHITLVVIAYFGYYALPANPENTSYYLNREKGAFIATTRDVWTNWDGGIYPYIAEFGYDKPLYLAFFPLYPLLIKAVDTIVEIPGVMEPYLNAGLIISFWSFFIALLLLFTLIKEKFSEKIAWITVWVILFFPTAFFFKATYTESLFLLLVVGIFYALHKKHWWIAALLAGLASGTKLLGIFLLPILLFEYIHSLKNSNIINLTLKKMWSIVGIILLASSGLILFLSYQESILGYPMGTFTESANYWHRYVSWDHTVSGLQRTLDSVFRQNLSTTCDTPGQIMQGEITTCPPNEILNLLSFLAFITIILFMAFTKEIPFSYTMVTFLFFIIPTLSGFLDAMPRYILVAFPIFLFIAIKLEKYAKIQPIYFAISGILLAVLTLIFTRGAWIA